MSLHIEQRTREGIVILDLTGALTSGEAGLALRGRLASLRRSGKVNIVLNLKEVSHIDSIGLGTLVFAHAKLRKARGRLALTGVNQAHMKLFLLTRLSIAFEFFADEQDTVNSFYPDRAVNHFDILEFVQRQEGRGGIQ